MDWSGITGAWSLIIIWSIILQTIPLKEPDNLLIMNASYEISLIPADVSGNLLLITVESIGQMTDIRTKRSIKMHLKSENVLSGERWKNDF